MSYIRNSRYQDLKEYPKYELCIKKLVWKYVRKSNFSFEELLSEAGQAFIHAVETYNKTKAGLHTHCFITVNGRLKNYIKNEYKKCYPLNENEQWGYLQYDTPEQNAIFNNLIENLSKEAFEVVQTVLNCPSEIVDLVRTMTSNRQNKMHLYRINITRFFRSKGWSNNQINSAYSEIKQTFNWS